jgi:hypothetical protein
MRRIYWPACGRQLCLASNIHTIFALVGMVAERKNETRPSQQTRSCLKEGTIKTSRRLSMNQQHHTKEPIYIKN